MGPSICRYCRVPAPLRLAFVFVLLLCINRPSFGQANTGTILGSVVDPSGAPVPDCKITVKELQTGVVKESKTDATGNYVVSYLLPGRYEVSAEAPSFRRSVEPEISLNVDQKAQVTFHLVVGAVSETVQVTRRLRCCRPSRWSKAKSSARSRCRSYR